MSNTTIKLVCDMCGDELEIANSDKDTNESSKTYWVIPCGECIPEVDTESEFLSEYALDGVITEDMLDTLGVD